MHVYGKLRIVASSEGQLESEPVFVTWSLLGNLRGLLLWLPLVLAIGLVRANRSLQAWWLAIPLVLPKAGLALLAMATGMPARVAGIFEYLALMPLAIALSVILLMGDRLGRSAKPVTWIMSAVVLMLVHALGLLAYGYSEELVLGLILVAIVDSTILLAVPLTAWCCRKRCTGRRFSFWLALWTLLASLIAVGIYGLVDEGDNMSLSMAMQIVFAGLAFGGILFVMQLPFVLLGTMNQFYSPRFMGLLGSSKETDPGLSQAADPETEES